MRIGQGFDAHRFADLASAGSIRLCGLDIPCDRAIIAHSDGDVMVHALCDALLGAIAAGDIGQHFPDTDDAYLNLDSTILLKRCIDRVNEQGYTLGNADLTLVAEIPRIGRYREQMCVSISKAMKVERQRVNVKASTTEGMGFTGLREGIAAFAVVLLEEI